MRARLINAVSSSFWICSAAASHKSAGEATSLRRFGRSLIAVLQSGAGDPARPFIGIAIRYDRFQRRSIAFERGLGLVGAPALLVGLGLRELQIPRRQHG